MRKILSGRRPSPAMIIAIVALVAALAGTAVAGSGGFVTKKKFGKLKSNALQRLTYVNNTQSVGEFIDTNFLKATATCPPGFHPVGGGVHLTPDNDALWFDDAYLTATGYASKIHNGSGNPGTVVTTVACVAGNASGAPAAS
jgi:hypothetical protein